jgi:pimeloyl-ACP methyl ester carboxylesterase
MRAFDFELQETTLHGHRVAYRLAGEGPPIILIHGVTSSSANWRRVAPILARHHTVLAPDLIGHGQSAKPRGDYSMGAFASGIRDLSVALGIGPATVVGHSLGGGVAMQFSYQFPERTDRLALVSSGGLGREVHLFLRAATLPGSELVLPLLAAGGIRAGSIAIARVLRRMGIRLGTDTVEIARGHVSLGDPESRDAFVQAMRASIDPGGQRVSATDRLYLAAQLPLLIVWGRRDRVIPVEHGEHAHELVPGSRLEVFERAGHFPHLDEPKQFAKLLEQWIRSTPAGHSDEARFRQAMLAGAALADAPPADAPPADAPPADAPPAEAPLAGAA